ncbi:MAG: hypothetical protein HQK60_17435 [Deltaproteobacteria bacterium]|nr:hypothetical protein [Deltaproteobacteria bacterium]
MEKKALRLNIDQIITSLAEVQVDFDKINNLLTMRREHLTDEIIQNLVAGYAYVDNLIARDVRIFPNNTEHLMEMNHIVLCGSDPKVRFEYSTHLQETQKRFYTLIQPIKQWYQKYHDSSSYRIASEIYVGVLSRPQLFIEGNHRTGSLIATYFLLTRGKPPFVLNKNNAIAYFEPSTQIKLSDKTSIRGKFRLPKYEKAFKTFLKAHTRNQGCSYAFKSSD